MGAAPAKPLGASEAKAFMNFKKFYKKDHPDIEECEIVRRATDAWGKLLPDQKKFYAVKPRPRPSAFARRKKQLVKKKLRKPRKNTFVIGSWKSSLRSIKRRSIMKFKRKNSGSSGRPPALSNAFLTFLREYRRKDSNMATMRSIQNGAREWMSLSKEHRDRIRAKVSL
ncbi:hypothetical protein KR074_008793 [Drosophila pseudoananassae]|nr:hypothetical protein KR074_008793 [Drosophila pseudoananassae]